MSELDTVGITTLVDTSLARFISILSAPALTTRFTYPPSCGSQWLQQYPDHSSASLYYSGYYFDSYFSDCQQNKTATFSPGICPDKLQLVTIKELKAVTGGPGQLWWGLCCNENFSSTQEYGLAMCDYPLPYGGPNLTVYRPETITHMITGSAGPTTSLETIFDVMRNTTVVSTGTKRVGGITVYWQARDISLFEPSYAAALASRLKIDLGTGSLGTATGTITTSAPTSASPGSTASMPSPTSRPARQSSLSTAAKSGIGIGAGLGVLIPMALLLILYRRHRKRKAEHAHPDQDNKADGTDAPEPVESHSEKAEVVEPSELEAQHRLSEMPSPVAELDGGGAWIDRKELPEKGRSE